MPRCGSSPHVPLYWTQSLGSVLAKTQFFFAYYLTNRLYAHSTFQSSGEFKCILI